MMKGRGGGRGEREREEEEEWLSSLSLRACVCKMFEVAARQSFIRRFAALLGPQS